MSEIPDPLEAELSALHPYEVSPGLRRRVAESLGDPTPAKLRRLWGLALAGGLAAACLTAVLLWWGGRRAEPEPIVVLPQPAPPVEVMPRPPADSARIAAWLEARRALDGAEMPAFTWPLEETSPLSVSTSIPPDLLD